MKFKEQFNAFLKQVNSLNRMEYSIRSFGIWAVLLPFVWLLSESSHLTNKLGFSAENSSITGLMILFVTLGLGSLITLINIVLMYQRLKDVLENRYNVLKVLIGSLVLGYLFPFGLVLFQLFLFLVPGKKYFCQFNEENKSIVLIEAIMARLFILANKNLAYLNSKISFSSLRTFFKS